MAVSIKIGIVAAFLTATSAQTVDVNGDTIATRACQGQFASLPFCNTGLSIDARVTDLIGRIQSKDIVAQLTARHNGGGNPGPTSNMSYIGVPDYDWGLNCIHGVQSSCVKDASGKVTCPTSFPNPVNFGYMWNKTAYLLLGGIIANETRAMWLAGAVEDSTWSGRPHIGLDVWSPNINIQRDPRWGRNVETPSEDPYLNGQYGSLHTQGLQQGVDLRYFPTVVTLKHWDAYSLEDSDGFTRHNFNAIVSNFSLADTYWPAFKESIIQGNAAGVMCSYNSVNGIPTCASEFLTQTTLRGAWGFTGYISSDTGAVEDIWQSSAHHYVPTGEDGACAAIRNGTTDVCSGSTYHDSLLSAVAAGKCSMADVQAALRRTLTIRMKLGLFDPIEDQPYWSMGLDTVGTPASLEAQWISTLEGQVLLKHDGKTLPVAAGKTIAVIGPHAKADSAMAGNYLGQLCPDNTFTCIQSPLVAITAQNNGGSTLYAPGCVDLTKNDTSLFAAAVKVAQSADFVVLMLGLDGSLEGESNDRTSIDLPYIQHELAATIASVGKPTMLVVFNGGSLDLTAELANPSIGAIVEAGYPGVLGGLGVSATAFGTNNRLGGKLPFTMYAASYVNDIKMSEMELDIGVGRTYRYYTGTPVLPFGFGLSMTTFSIVNVTSGSPSTTRGVLHTEPVGWAMRKAGEAARPAAHGLTLSYSVNVTNTGMVAGDEVIQAYFLPTDVPGYIVRAGTNPLTKQLWDFARVHLEPGQSQLVSFTASAATFRLTDRDTGDTLSLPGTYSVRLTNGVDVAIEHTVKLEGQAAVVAPFPGRALPVA